jgi:voltage-gated potassium channel
MNPKLVIVARADSDSSEPKLRRAGATHVISPYRIAGRRIATQLLHPNVSDFLDLVMHTGALELWMKEVAVSDGSEMVGRTLHEARLREDLGINVLAVAGLIDGEMITTPPDTYVVRAGDRLIVLGTNEQLGELARLAATR